MFDLRKFWLGMSVYVLIIGGVIAAVGVAFNALIGMPTRASQQVVTQPVETTGGKVGRVETGREVAVPASLPQPSSVPRKAATGMAEALPQLAEPKSLIAPEPRSTRRAPAR
jgi:hypothetical protein